MVRVLDSKGRRFWLRTPKIPVSILVQDALRPNPNLLLNDMYLSSLYFPLVKSISVMIQL